MGSLTVLQRGRSMKASMPSLPLLLLLLWGVGSHGFPTVTSGAQEQDTELVQVKAEFHTAQRQEPLFAFLLSSTE